jgi:hypothetical protein
VALPVLFVVVRSLRGELAVEVGGGDAAVCVALIAYEVIRHREGRAAIRARRGALTVDDVARLERERP